MRTSSNEAITIWGIDPGFRNIGFGVVQFAHGSFSYLEAGTWNTKGALSAHALLQEKIKSLFELYRPSAVFVEQLFFEKNVRSAMRVAEMRGVIYSELSSRGTHPYDIAPTAVKRSLCGYGRADKEALSRMVQAVLKVKLPPSTHATDALAIAIAGWLSKPRHPEFI